MLAKHNLPWIALISIAATAIVYLALANVPPSPNETDATALSTDSRQTAPLPRAASFRAPRESGSTYISANAAPSSAPLVTNSPPPRRMHSVAKIVPPENAQVPAALLESESPLPPALAAAKDGIAQEFQREVADAMAESNTPSKNIEETWVAAKAKADEKFRALFGEEAAGDWRLEAARKVLPVKPQ